MIAWVSLSRSWPERTPFALPSSAGLHPAMAEDALRLPTVQPGVGKCLRWSQHALGSDRRLLDTGLAQTCCTRQLQRSRVCAWLCSTPLPDFPKSFFSYSCFLSSQEFSKIERIVGGSANAE